MSKSIIGIDLNERYCQISFYHEEQQEPQTLENVTYPVSDLYRKAVEQARGEEVRGLAEFLEKSLEQL